MHAAVIAINEAVDQGVPEGTLAAMQNPNAMLVNLDAGGAREYHHTLYQAKGEKVASSRKRVSGGAEAVGAPRSLLSWLESNGSCSLKRERRSAGPRSRSRFRLASRNAKLWYWLKETGSFGLCRSDAAAFCPPRLPARCGRDGPRQQMENADAERDVYDELLTQAEIQGNVNKVNGKSRTGSDPRVSRSTSGLRSAPQWQTPRKPPNGPS